MSKTNKNKKSMKTRDVKVERAEAAVPQQVKRYLTNLRSDMLSRMQGKEIWRDPVMHVRNNKLFFVWGNELYSLSINFSDDASATVILKAGNQKHSYKTKPLERDFDFVDDLTAVLRMNHKSESLSEQYKWIAKDLERREIGRRD